MSRIISVAIREFAATCLNKAFFFGAIVMPILVYGLIILFATTGILTGEKPVLKGTVAIMDQTDGQFIADALEEFFDPEAQERLQEEREAEAERTADALAEEAGGLMPETQREMMVRMVGAGLPMEIALERVDPGADVDSEKARVLEPDGPLMLITVDPSVMEIESGSFGVFHRQKINHDYIDAITDQVQDVVVERRLADADFSREQLDAIDRLQRQPASNLTTVTEQGERDTNTVLMKVLPFIFLMLLWIAVMTGGQYLLMSTIEEKSTRVMEVLLSAVSPLNLMIGKILGQAAVGLLWLGMYCGLGLVAAAQFGVMSDIKLGVLVWLVIYFVMAYLFFASLFAAAGSAVTDIREANAFVTPIMLLLIIPLMLMFPISENPESILANALSYFPPTTPFVMVMRMAQPGFEVSVIELAATSAIGFIGVFAMMWGAAKIFRVGVLMYGQPPTFLGLLKWLRQS